MAGPELTDRILRQGEALGTIAPSGPVEPAVARVLLTAYKRRLWGVVEAAPAWVTEKILSASEHIGDDRTVLRFGEN